jgi:hypothetical protein
MSTQIVRTLLAAGLVMTAASLATSIAVAQSIDDPGARAHRLFDAITPLNADAWLNSARPQPLGAALRARVLATLPTEGELRPSTAEAEMLAALEPILRYHGRQGVYTFKLIDLRRAFIGLHARTVVIISRPALGLLNTSELRALIGHEIGHEFFWSEYQSARERNDAGRLQELELKSDGVAVLTLVALGMDPAPLLGGVRKLTRFNEGIGLTANDGYPSLSDRLRFARQLTDRLRRPPRAN